MATQEGQQAIRDQVTAKMIAALERGVVPWHKPWQGSGAAGFPCSLSSKRPYRGVNVWLLGLTALERGYRSPWWGTYKAIIDLGGKVREGQSHKNGLGSTGIILSKTYPRTEIDEKTGDKVTRRIPVMRWHAVFNAEQADGLPDWCYPSAEDRGGNGLLPEPEEVLMGYLHRDGAPGFRYAGDRACYSPGEDMITIPHPEGFDSPSHRYATEFHECGHSTGHQSRLGRAGIAGFDHFGSERYADEELIAEMTSAYLCAMTGIDGDGIFDNSAAYLGNWLAKLRNDHKLIFRASARAGEAVDCVLGRVTTYEEK
jgi:antirestriction protein ArdC